MGWIISFIFLVTGIVTQSQTAFVVAGLFAIAGSIEIKK